MTKKKDKITKVSPPVTKAIYPIRCGTIVHAIVWLEQTFITGKVIQTYSTTMLNVAGSDHYYDIETANGEVYETINENNVFITKKELKEMVEVHLTLSSEVE